MKDKEMLSAFPKSWRVSGATWRAETEAARVARFLDPMPDYEKQWQDLSW